MIYNDTTIPHQKILSTPEDAELPPLVANIDALKVFIAPEVLKEAETRGYVYNDELKVFIKEDKCKTLDQMVGKLKKIEIDPIEVEAKRQGYSYNSELMIYLNDQGDGKLREDFEEELKLPEVKVVRVNIVNGKLVRKPDDAEGKLKAGVIRPSSNRNFAKLSDKQSILCLFDVYIDFEAYLKELEAQGWKIENDQARYLNQAPRTLNDLKENVFKPVQIEFLNYLRREGYDLDLKTGDFRFGISPVTLDEAIQLNDLFRPRIPSVKVHTFSDHFEVIKGALSPLFDFRAFKQVMESKGYSIDSDLREDWAEQKADTALKFKEYGYDYVPEVDVFKHEGVLYTFEAVCDTLKEELIELVKAQAEAQLGMIYDPEIKCFKSKYYLDFPMEKSVSEVLIEIMLKDFGLS